MPDNLGMETNNNAPSRISLTTPCCNRNVQGMNMPGSDRSHEVNVCRSCTVCNRPYWVTLRVEIEAGSQQFELVWATRRIHWTNRITGQAHIGNQPEETV